MRGNVPEGLCNETWGAIRGRIITRLTVMMLNLVGDITFGIRILYAL